MSIRAVVRTTHAGRYILECGIEEEFDVAADAFARLDELKPMIGVKPPTPTEDPGLVFVPPATGGGTFELHEPEQDPELKPVTKPRKRWSEEECAVIAGATSPTDAATKYREAFPDSPRSDYAAVKKYGKMKQQQPVEVKASDIRIPVTLHEPVEEVPEQEPIKKKKAYKNAWTPEEDDIVRDAPSSEDAARLHAVAFPGKRTPAAIDARWRKFNPSTLQKLKEVAAPNPDLPERGANVLIVGPAGRCTGKTGTVIRRDQRIGEILVNAGADGCVWLKPGHVEVVDA